MYNKQILYPRVSICPVLFTCVVCLRHFDGREFHVDVEASLELSVIVVLLEKPLS